jgi:quercetin dioxygenase-like cupin family protein
LQAALAPVAAHTVEHAPFGRLVWMVSGPLGNSTTMTVGRCHIEPGKANPRHFHPNCDEVLYLLQGRIRHTLDDESVEMRAGDAISIPAGAVHNAENIGADEVICMISFSSPDRQVVGE